MAGGCIFLLLYCDTNFEFHYDTREFAMVKTYVGY